MRTHTRTLTCTLTCTRPAIIKHTLLDISADHWGVVVGAAVMAGAVVTGVVVTAGIEGA